MNPASVRCRLTKYQKQGGIVNFGIDFTQASTLRGISRLVFGVASVYFLMKGDAVGAVGVLTAGKFVDGTIGVGVKD